MYQAETDFLAFSDVRGGGGKGVGGSSIALNKRLSANYIKERSITTMCYARAFNAPSTGPCVHDATLSLPHPPFP